MSLTLVTPVAADTYPLVLLDVRRQTKTEGVTVDDDLIEDFIIPAVTERAEIATGRQLLFATWKKVLDVFPCEGWIDIPKPPLAGFVVITYIDPNGVTQTFGASNYDVDAPVGPRCRRGRVMLAYGASWPT